jgi:hypothetical protein
MNETELLERVLSDGSSLQEKKACAQKLLQRLERNEVTKQSIELLHNGLESDVWKGQPEDIQDMLQVMAMKVESLEMNSRKYERPLNHSSGSFKTPQPSHDSGSWNREAQRVKRERARASQRGRRITPSP